MSDVLPICLFKVNIRYVMRKADINECCIADHMFIPHRILTAFNR